MTELTRGEPDWSEPAADAKDSDPRLPHTKLSDAIRLCKEAGVTRLDLYENGAPKRIEFGSSFSLVDAGPTEAPEQSAGPSAVESAALRLAGRAKKAGAK